MVQKKTEKVRKIEKKHFNSSIGQIEAVNVPRSKVEASKYCEENDGMLISLHNQEIVDEVSEKLQNADFNKKINFFHAGLDCKNGIYQWQDGMKFNGSNYNPSLQLPKDSCQNLYLQSITRSKKFQLITSHSDADAPFLCLKNRKSKPTTNKSTITITKAKTSSSFGKRQTAATLAETTIEPLSSNRKTTIILTEPTIKPLASSKQTTIKPLSGNKQTATLFTCSNKEVSNNSLLIGLSFGSILLLALICFIILVKILRKANYKYDTNNVKLQNAKVQEKNHHFADIEDANNQENIVNERNEENVIYSMADDNC